MNLTELRAQLVRRGIDQRWYSFVGPEEGERFCLIQSGQRWETYYAEHGEKNCLKVFEDEAAACEYFLEWILKDRVVALPEHLSSKKS